MKIPKTGKTIVRVVNKDTNTGKGERDRLNKFKSAASKQSIKNFDYKKKHWISSYCIFPSAFVISRPLFMFSAVLSNMRACSTPSLPLEHTRLIQNAAVNLIKVQKLAFHRLPLFFPKKLQLKPCDCSIVMSRKFAGFHSRVTKSI